MIKAKLSIGFVALVFHLLACSGAESKPETKGSFEARTRWWREAKFGMFIHWGVYAVPADSTKGIAEWYMYNHQVQVKDYEKFAAQFNPVKFDAKQWVRTARKAGMKYLVITSKHHDGFCMFDSKLTDYSITRATPFRRDPMKELASECKKQGLVFCFYHSIMDWHHPDYLPRRPWEKDDRPAAGAEFDRYIEYMQGQLKELLTRYGPLGVIWFDGGWEHSAKELHSGEVNAMIRSLQPRIIINDRNQLSEDFSTPEQTIPANALPGGRLWETCMTMNDTWGYSKNDHNWKPAEDLIRKLCDIASKGGNFLLNVGPTAEGTFPEEINERLARIGEWMKVNGSSIYGTTKSPFRRLSFDGRCTVKGRRIFLQVFHWPEEGLSLAGVQTPVRSARALKGNERLKVTVNKISNSSSSNDGGMVTQISKPRQVDSAATVVELRFDSTPVVVDTPVLLKPDDEGVLTLKAVDAEIHGDTARYEQGNGKDNIGYWTDWHDYVTWQCGIPNEGAYRVEIVYACPNENAGSRFNVGLEGGPVLSAAVKPTGSWTAFQTMDLGDLRFSSGKQTVYVRVTEMPNGAVMNLQRVRLIPLGRR